MASYSLRIKKSAERELRSVPKPDLERILRRLQALSAQPRPAGSEKLSGEEKYRIRQGDWRVVYFIDDSQKVIEIYKVGHRREIYKHLH